MDVCAAVALSMTMKGILKEHYCVKSWKRNFMETSRLAESKCVRTVNILIRSRVSDVSQRTFLFTFDVWTSEVINILNRITLLLF